VHDAPPGEPAGRSTVTEQRAAEPAPVAEAGAQAAALSERDARVLRFEQRTWRYPAAKEAAIRAEFGLSPARYYQLLNALIESPAALAAEPVLVGRLGRLRAARRQGWSPATAPAGEGGAAVAAYRDERA
jgi:hypothetical protein